MDTTPFLVDVHTSKVLLLFDLAALWSHFLPHPIDEFRNPGMRRVSKELLDVNQDDRRCPFLMTCYPDCLNASSLPCCLNPQKHPVSSCLSTCSSNRCCGSSKTLMFAPSDDALVETCSHPPAPSIVRHRDYYFEDGNLVILVRESGNAFHSFPLIVKI